MTVTTFYPDAHPESDSFDGDCRIDQQAAWDTAHDAAVCDNVTGTSDGSAAAGIKKVSGAWRFHRLFILFDTSSLAGQTIDSATLDVVGLFGDDDFGSGTINIVSAAPASNTGLVVGDYDSMGTTSYSTDIAISGITFDGATFKVSALNATGLAAIDTGGVSKFGMRSGRDVSDSEPSASNDDAERAQFMMAEETGTGDLRPRLVVTHHTAFTPQAIMF